MRSRPRKHTTGPVAAAVVLSALLALLWGAPGTAAASPDTATPAPGSPAGTEYGLPFDQGRGAGGGGSHTGSGGPVGSGGGGGGGGASGTGGTGGGGGVARAVELFGAGIVPVRHSTASRSGRSDGGSSGGSSSRSSPGGKGHRGASDAVRDTVMSARAVAERAASQAGGAEGQVALIVLLLLGTGAGLAIVIRLASRRSPRAGAA